MAARGFPSIGCSPEIGWQVEAGAADGARESLGGPFRANPRQQNPASRMRTRDFAVWLQVAGVDQNAASSSSMISLSIVSNTARVLVSSGRKFFAKNDA